MSRWMAAGPFALAALLGASTSAAQSGAPVAAPIGFASATEIAAAIGQMEAEMKPAQGFLWRPLVRGDGSVAALEYWKKPGRPAVHPNEAEYAIVVAGAGTLVMDGRLRDPIVTRPGLTEGSAIEDGTSRALHPGDVMLIPAGVPHWFGVDGGKLVLLGIKLVPQPSS